MQSRVAVGWREGKRWPDLGREIVRVTIRVIVRVMIRVMNR